MNAPLQVTRTTDVAAPELERLVALPVLKTQSGAPVVVRCRRIGLLQFSEVVGGLPGEQPKSAWDQMTPAQQREKIEAWWRRRSGSRPRSRARCPGRGSPTRTS
jgi:hypothetical protein